MRGLSQQARRPAQPGNIKVAEDVCVTITTLCTKWSDEYCRCARQCTRSAEFAHAAKPLCFLSIYDCRAYVCFAIAVICLSCKPSEAHTAEVRPCNDDAPSCRPRTRSLVRLRRRSSRAENQTDRGPQGLKSLYPWQRSSPSCCETASARSKCTVREIQQVVGQNR